MKRVILAVLALILLYSPARAADKGWWIGGAWLADQALNEGRASKAGANVVREVVDGVLEAVTLGAYDRAGGKVVVREYAIPKGAKVNDAYYYGEYISPYMYQPPLVPPYGWRYYGWYGYYDYYYGYRYNWRRSWPPPPKECYQRGYWEGRRERARRECWKEYRRGYRDGLKNIN